MGSIVFMNAIDRFVEEHKDRILPHFIHLIGAKFTNLYDSDEFQDHFYAGAFTLDNGETYPVHFAWVPEEGKDPEEVEGYRQGMLSLEGCEITSLTIDGFELYEDVYLHICVDGDSSSTVCVPLGYNPYLEGYFGFLEDILV